MGHLRHSHSSESIEVLISAEGEGILGPEAVPGYKKTDASDTAWQQLILTLSNYGNKFKIRASSS